MWFGLVLAALFTNTLQIRKVLNSVIATGTKSKPPEQNVKRLWKMRSRNQVHLQNMHGINVMLFLLIYNVVLLIYIFINI